MLHESRLALAELRRALVRIDQTRASMRTGTERGIELWRALMTGQCSIVERFSDDLNEFYLLCRTSPSRSSGARLSPREKQVLNLANLGFSNKLIAHTLELSISSVSQYLARARKKLGVRGSLAALATLDSGALMLAFESDAVLGAT